MAFKPCWIKGNTLESRCNRNVINFFVFWWSWQGQRCKRIHFIWLIKSVKKLYFSYWPNTKNVIWLVAIYQTVKTFTFQKNLVCEWECYFTFQYYKMRWREKRSITIVLSEIWGCWKPRSTICSDIIPECWIEQLLLIRSSQVLPNQHLLSKRLFISFMRPYS